MGKILSKEKIYIKLQFYLFISLFCDEEKGNIGLVPAVLGIYEPSV